MRFNLYKQISLHALIALILFGCKTYSEEDHSNFESKIQQYIKKHKLIGFEKSESGLYYKIDNEGKGEYIKLTDEVTFNYEGKLLNGNIFDGEHKKNPISFQMNELIQGWQEGMMYLKPGGKMKMIVPPHLGYGDYELDKIPPHSILYFEIEVINVK
jgi:FKBP-type peptidyl-prolyl cis-trans isomerase FkpA